MQFRIKGTPVDVSVTTVVLDSNLTDNLEGLILWHCPIDNQPLFQYSGRQVMIIPGMVPNNVPVIVQCSKCKTKYLIVSII